MRMFPIYVVDYVWVMTLYGTIAFFLAVLIDGHILPAYDQAKTEATSTPMLYFLVILQFALQGFLVLLVASVLQTIPSPVSGVRGYNPHCALGSTLIRNPAILTIVLLSLSESLMGRLKVLFSRFDRNAKAQLRGQAP